MPYALQVFESTEQQTLRSVSIDGAPWFVLADVCRALGLKPNKGSFWRHLRNMDERDHRTVARSDVEDGPSLHLGEGDLTPSVNGGRLLCINEAGIYTLVFRSRRPEAQRFQRWVTSEVLPAIRKTGAFSIGPAPVPAEWQAFHDRVASAWGAVPEGYFSIFKESAAIVADLIRNGVKVDHTTIPDIPFGMAWGKEWAARGYEHDYGPRVSYAHCYPPSFPQSKSNPQWAYCYPEEALPAFRRWVRQVFLKDGMPKYLQNKVAKGHIAAPVAGAVMKAIAASAPKPLR